LQREEGFTRFEDHAGREEANRKDDAWDEEGTVVVMATQTISASPKMRALKPFGTELHQIEKDGPRNTNYNETVRANNKRYDSGAPGKTLPRGKVADQTWRKKKARSSGR
jgi:hypothetical protein